MPDERNIVEASSLTLQVEPLLLTAREAAAALRISTKTLWNLTQPRGTIPALRIGPGERSVRYSVDSLRRWIAEQSDQAT
jgi:hypothetical protein